MKNRPVTRRFASASANVYSLIFVSSNLLFRQISGKGIIFFGTRNQDGRMQDFRTDGIEDAIAGRCSQIFYNLHKSASSAC